MSATEPRRLAPARFVLATFNRDKARELEILLRVPGLDLASLADFPRAIPPEETGATLFENAHIKAEAARRHTGLSAIADDTGLEVDALDGAPGVYAARFSGEGATYESNVRLLLEKLGGVPPDRRGARFRTVCVAVLADGTEVAGEGVLEGRIAESARGSAGFGYDPVFIPEGETRTLAEMTADEKNALSHRGRAARALVAALADRG